MKNILQICQDVAAVVCVQAPTTLFGSTGQNEKIFLSVANDALNGLLRYGDWQELTKDGVLRTVAGKSDYPIASFCPDFYQLLNNTVYIRDGAEKAYRRGYAGAMAAGEVFSRHDGRREI